jgi:type IV pilus assembly protein PilA
MRPAQNPERGALRARLRRKCGESGFTLIELLIVVAIILILAAIAIPNLIQSKIAANQASAAENVRTITSASIIYYSSWANGYPPTLGSLSGTGTTSSCDQANLLDPLLSTAPYEKSGYKYSYTGELGPATQGPGCGAPGFNGYLVTAVPLTTTTGTDSFCSDEPATIHVDTSGAAIASQTTCEGLPAMNH